VISRSHICCSDGCFGICEGFDFEQISVWV
jgi:hypothetical protein